MSIFHTGCVLWFRLQSAMQPGRDEALLVAKEEEMIVQEERVRSSE